MAVSRASLSSLRGPLVGVVEGGSLGKESPSGKLKFLLLVDMDKDLNIKIFTYGDSGFPPGGVACVCVISCCCWGGMIC